MSILSKIKDFLSGKQTEPDVPERGGGVRADMAASSAPPVPPLATAVPVVTPSAPQPSAAHVEPIDIEGILDKAATAAGEPLNWRTSIVDLMKLCGIDPSLDNRRELADELGYAGDKVDTVSMNIWLHTQVLRKLEEGGGKVPAELKD